ncbi:DUF302 domain-containing protein [Nocardia farcinica]|uniref:DUF302 domain-containing protein n=1 Tax=Nocardia farcinica TaxID=37329 RepID=UPI0024568D7E|nr:DUF302 domain-containing protein [Nocardia farcinica]
MDFTLEATVAEPYEQTLARVRAGLADAGFGVLTEIDLSATLRAKLGVETPPQVILGACRPQLAHRAVQADPRVAALLPCNVVVRSAAESATAVTVMDPDVLTSLSDRTGLSEVVADARTRLTGLLADLTEAEAGHAPRS